jgi:hypothetical protein
MPSTGSSRLVGVSLSRGERRAPKGEANGAWKHGRFTNEARELRRQAMALVRKARRSLESI